jgi:hypothetical protein
MYAEKGMMLVIKETKLLISLTGRLRHHKDSMRLCLIMHTLFMTWPTGPRPTFVPFLAESPGKRY